MARAPQVKTRIDGILGANCPISRRWGTFRALAMISIAAPLLLRTAGLDGGEGNPAAAKTNNATSSDNGPKRPEDITTSKKRTNFAAWTPAPASWRLVSLGLTVLLGRRRACG